MSSDRGAVLELEIEISQEEVLRGLGYQGGRPSIQVRQRLAGICEAAGPLLRPQGSCRVVEGTRAAALGVPELGLFVGLALCTIGPALEKEVAALSAGDRLLEALLLDTVGSVAAEAAADALNRELCADARAQGFHAGPRSSPGYSGWPLERQRDLLTLLPAQELGVTLTDGNMMVPEKSVSFAVPYLEAPWSGAVGPCRRCTRPDCAFRTDMTAR